MLKLSKGSNPEVKLNIRHFILVFCQISLKKLQKQHTYQVVSNYLRLKITCIKIFKIRPNKKIL